MDSIEILITACLIANPATCETKSVPVGQVADVRQCMMWAQPHLAEWAGTHPKFRIARWRCAVIGSGGEDI